MSKIFKVALVGRPNVGKSALFNRICRRRKAIVDAQEGVTRDRLYAEADYFGKPFEVIDTGGIDDHGKIPYYEEVKRQAEIAIEEADSLIMVVDAQVGVTDLDEIVARGILEKGKPVCVAVNKVDDRQKEILLHEFHSLGIDKMVAVSAAHGYQIAELLEVALEIYQPYEEAEEDGSIKVAIIGRPNVGKSTLMNYILEEERCVVSPIAGTTRDSVDVALEMGDKRYILIDTAGIRRKRSEREVVDKFAAVRTERAIKRADVCLLMADTREGLTSREKSIAKEIEKQGKGAVVLFNKWDLVKGFRMEHCVRGIEEETTFLGNCPLLFGSAKTGKNITKLFESIDEVDRESKKRVTTGQLNTFIERAIQKVHPPMIRSKRLRIYYMAQVHTAPPCFVLFVNHPNLMLDSYKRYLINCFRKEYGFKGSPINFVLRGKADHQT